MIKLFSTDMQKKVPLETKVEGELTMYVCGPTVYDSCHIGHARPAVVFDTIRRYLEFAGHVVTFVSNVTDIDDKIIRRSNELGVTQAALAGRYQDEYERDMAALGVRSPTIRPRATEHIPEMIEMIKGLEEKGVAYTTPRGVWFDISKFSEYGKLSGRVADDEETEHRVEQDSDKRNIQDFALWKFVKPGEPSWPSPWGEGRPGWHIECSVMSGKYCNFELDIHGGGSDLIFPHHENEIAQSEAFTGKQFVRYWLHNGFITVGKESEESGDEEVKMGKSKGNAFWLSEAFRIAPPAALRLWILGTHYRSALLYKPELLETAMSGLDRIYTCIEELERSSTLKNENNSSTDLNTKCDEAIDKFKDVMNDDFNSPQALAVLFDLVTEINTALRSECGADEALYASNTMIAILGVLGLPLQRPTSSGAEADDFIQALVELRSEARSEKNFTFSDRIRDRLTAMGIEINDRTAETTWKRIS